MRIRNANIYTEEHRFVRGDAAVENGRFVSCTGEPAGEEAVVDAEGMYLIPGLVDIHFHGCKGADMCDGTKEALDVITSYEASVGVTSVCPATMTIPKDELLEVMKNAGSYEYSGGSHLVGINMEGPFISPAKKGAQAEKYIVDPEIEMFDRLYELSGDAIKLIDVAPELPGAAPFIERASKKCVVSIAHTTANYDQAKAAFAAGASHVTHLFNAMPPFNHRDPGVVGAASDDAAHVEMISDGIHLHPAVVRSVFRWFGAERVCLISDSMRAAGMPNGVYSLGGQTVYMTNGKATLEDGTIAGSATCLAECFRRAVSFGVPLDAALRAATINPAQAVGLFDELGSITAGKRADILVLDETLHPEKIFIGGVQTK